jgi:hypothetical protein
MRQETRNRLERKSLVERINSLPLWARDYIMNIQTNGDPAGLIRRVSEQDDLIRQLVRKIAELKGTPVREKMPLGSNPGSLKSWRLKKR